MRVWTNTNGDRSHTPTDPLSDVKEWASFHDARTAFASYVRDPHEMCDETTTWDVFFYNPLGDDVTGEAYPDRRFALGARGGVVVESC